MTSDADRHVAEDEVAMLILQRGGQGSQRWRLDKPEMLIGRLPDCDIVLPDRQVSRHHARIFRKGDTYYIEDLRSKNGTWVNGQPLRGVRALEDGDEIQIALRFKLAFVGSGATAPLNLDESVTEVERGLRVDEGGRRVFVNGREVMPPLSPSQFRLLALLWRAQGGVVSREEIVQHVWAEDASEGVTEQALDALVRRLRERLAEYDPDHMYVVTVRGHGYRLENR
ncbi:MAG: FHA domain-containing protein [Chloroflexi bacterium]|nr:FHA domain-containing protein [Chloroflexota bacterium]